MSCGFSIRFYWVCLWTGDFPASKIHSASSTLDEKQPKKTNCRRQKKEHYLFIYQSGRNDDSKVSGGNSCSSSPPPSWLCFPSVCGLAAKGERKVLFTAMRGKETVTSFFLAVCPAFVFCAALYWLLVLMLKSLWIWGWRKGQITPLKVDRTTVGPNLGENLVFNGYIPYEFKR